MCLTYEDLCKDDTEELDKLLIELFQNWKQKTEALTGEEMKNKQTDEFIACIKERMQLIDLNADTREVKIKMEVKTDLKDALARVQEIGFSKVRLSFMGENAILEFEPIAEKIK